MANPETRDTVSSPLRSCEDQATISSSSGRQRLAGKRTVTTVPMLGWLSMVRLAP
jgi:hypothetical protein